MKRAIVLSGGGSYGAFQVGVLDYLINKIKLNFQIIVGTSVGALNAAILGQANNFPQLTKEMQNLKKAWLNIKGTHSIYHLNYWGIGGLLFGNSLYRPSGLKNLIKKYVDSQRLANSSSLVKISTVALETGELLYVNNQNPEFRPHLLEFILASASIPPFFPPVVVNDKHWYDGGLRDITPLKAAFNENPEEIIIILTHPIDFTYRPVLPCNQYRGVVNICLRTINILLNEIAAGDLELVLNRTSNYHQLLSKEKIPIRLIAPSKPLAGKNNLKFDPQNIRHNIEQGYRDAGQIRLLAYKKKGA